MCPECRHIMPTGVKCHSPALRGKPYCYFHIRRHSLAPRPAPKPEEPLKLPNLADRGNIRTALGQVLNALGSSRLTPRRAGLFLYALQIASRNIERIPATGARASAGSITRAPGNDDPSAKTSPRPSPPE